MKFERDRTINLKLCDGVEIVNGEVYMYGCYMQFIDPTEFLKEFNLEDYAITFEEYVKRQS